MSRSTLTSKGQTTIPKDIRKRLNLHPGDHLEFVIDENGRVLMLPASIDALELAGMLKPLAQPVSVADMNRTIRTRGSRPILVSTRTSWSDIECRTIPANLARPPR